MTRRDLFHKWLFYALALVPVWLLDAQILPRLPLFGVTPMLLPLAAAAVAVLEGAYAGTGFGLAVGLWWEAAYPGGFGGLVFGLALAGLIMGHLSQYVLRQSFPGYLLCAAGQVSVVLRHCLTVSRHTGLFVQRFLQQFIRRLFVGGHAVAGAVAFAQQINRIGAAPVAGALQLVHRRLVISAGQRRPAFGQKVGAPGADCRKGDGRDSRCGQYSQHHRTAHRAAAFFQHFAQLLVAEGDAVAALGAGDDDRDAVLRQRAISHHTDVGIQADRRGLLFFAAVRAIGQDGFGKGKRARLKKIAGDVKIMGNAV